MIEQRQANAPEENAYYNLAAICRREMTELRKLTHRIGQFRQSTKQERFNAG